VIRSGCNAGIERMMPQCEQKALLRLPGLEGVDRQRVFAPQQFEIFRPIGR